MQPCSATVFPYWVSEPWVNTSLCVSVCVCVAKILQPTFSFTFYSDEVIAFHMPWPASPNDRVGEEAAPQTFGCIIHQPTAPTTNNYILVGGGGWGPVEHCPVNHTHTHTHTHSLYHTHTHRNIWMNLRQENDISRADQNILKSFLVPYLGQNTNIWNRFKTPRKQISITSSWSKEGIVWMLFMFCTVNGLGRWERRFSYSTLAVEALKKKLINQ